MRGREAGFTLVEVLISLGLFGLIAIAGLALVTGIMNVRGRTEVRLDRLAEVQRTMTVVSSDLDQIAAGRVTGGGGDVAFTRAAPGAGGAAIPIRYAVVDGALVRFVGPRPQLLLPGVGSARWRFWDAGWVERWPRSAEAEQIERWPRAVEMQLQLAAPAGPGGSLRRVVVLPVRVDKP